MKFTREQKFPSATAFKFHRGSIISIDVSRVPSHQEVDPTWRYGEIRRAAAIRSAGRSIDLPRPSDLHPRGTYVGREREKLRAPEPFNSPSREILRKAISAVQTLSRGSGSRLKALTQKEIFRMNETLDRVSRKLLYRPTAGKKRSGKGEDCAAAAGKD